MKQTLLAVALVATLSSGEGWAASALVPVPVECPEGGFLRGAAPPNGFEQWCERRGGDNRPGYRQGPYRAWHASGQAYIESSYCGGVRCGRYAEWYAGGKPKSLGEFDAQGRYQGHWSFWTETGGLIEQDFTEGKLVRSTTSSAPVQSTVTVGAAAAAAAVAANAAAASADAGATVTAPVSLATATATAPANPVAARPPAAPALARDSGTGGSAWSARTTAPTVAPPTPPVPPTAATPPASPVACPPRAVAAGEGYPQGLVQWCQKQNHYGQWVRHGILREWFPNGQLRSESDYVNGRPTGWVTRWYPNGVKAEETHYLYGVPDGRSVRWNETGMLLGDQVFDHGLPVGSLRP